MTDLNGKAAVVTGASRGIGEAAARELAAQGVAVVLAARSTDDIARIAAEIRDAGGRAEAVACNVTRYEDVVAAIEACQAAFGRFDILVNNAGLIEPIARLAESDPEDWVMVADVNYKGVYYGLRAAIPVMKRSGGGVTVNISSAAATGVLEGWSHYCAAKAAVLSLTKSAHRENMQDNIRVVGVSPGTVATDMQRTIQASGINPVSMLDWSWHIPPEWVAEAVVWLITDAGREYDGGDFQLKSREGKRAVGLVA